ncbi:hypothetical protein V5E97_08775 [Singulisphaera sp. Ch08]|uniref:Uncharacterized protein n=1 Tax=Singulisphaera sp. Ch08 TaxID=3120278 RepID=A0AAU7CKZ0_9BACT
MKLLSSRLFSLAVLAVLTAVFTSNLMAQKKSGKTAQALRYTTAASKPAAHKKVKPNAIPGPNLASIERVSMKADVDGNNVSVEMVASIYDIRPRISYVWGLKVKSPDGRQTLSEKLYRDQVFTLQGEKSAKPTFSERLDLESGRYMIEVSSTSSRPDSI